MPHRVVILVFPNFQLLDMAGPASAFELANEVHPGAYSLELRAVRAGRVRASSGVWVQASGLGRVSGVGTLVVAGGVGARSGKRPAALIHFIRSCAQTGARVASICTGSFLLAAAGVLDDKRATTHWSRSQEFRAAFPRVQVDADRIFVQDGRVWTSAGISAGIDLSLALVTEDLGEAVSRRVAQELVVYHRRPGGQSQFSTLLELEPAAGRFEGMLDYVRSHLGDRLKVEDLARWAGMSPRNFARAFTRATGLTPAKVIERLRVEAARNALERDGSSIAEVARSCGFGDPERMRRSFVRVYGMPPTSVVRGR